MPSPPPCARRDPQVRHLRQVLLWPLRLMPLPAGTGERPWELLTPNWREEVDEYTGDAEDFHERHYNEFVTFLPYVQRFLYGEGAPRAARRRGGRLADAGVPPPRRGARCAWCRARATRRSRWTSCMSTCTSSTTSTWCCSTWRSAPTTCRWRRRRTCCTASAAPTRPAGTRTGQALHCMAERASGWAPTARCWRAPTRSDRDAFLAHVAEHRAPRIAAHWAFLLEPLVSDHSGRPGALRFRQIEYYRMPMMAYLALDDPRALTRNDFVRLGLVTAAPAGRQRRRAALCRAAPGRFRGTPLLRPLLVRRRRRAEHALPVQRPCAGGGGRRARAPSTAAPSAACWRSSATSISCCS